ncbi:hypothetical protein [Paracidovorax wautersii]|uniref:Uncharacterized protein n=1 Tax=Paracidovorax wautersii TaxID=1177982 RepID=A0A1I2E790_9BURK|nr:hypothetical protein [Paracidovorax wautersii]SFE88573.1 hypothetical protein SAMN04489711_106266 [Paracidovorax wautersii]
MSERLTQAELGRQLGVTRQAIHKLLEAGKITADGDGLIDLEAARVAIANNVHPGSKTAQAVTAGSADDDLPVTIPEAAEQFAGGGKGRGKGEGMPANFLIARTMREMEEARIARLKREEMEGLLIRVTAVEAVWAASLAQAREKLLQIAARLSPMLAAETDPLKVDNMLQDELNQALQLLAGCDVKPKPAEGSV